MKIKSHSGLKKRVKIRKRSLMLQKASRNHLLINKSKRQKKLNRKGKPIDSTYTAKVKKLLPGLGGR